MIYRHGDWNFSPCSFAPYSGEIIKTTNEFIFATGEATNHHHIAIVPRPEDMEWIKQEDGGYIVTFKSEARLTHPEHSHKTDLIVPPGTYRVFQHRERDYFANVTRRVID